jgi:Orsellinic acid/F9775 biosynthesis cluster protein D
MSFQDINSYITHLPEFKVIICHFCESCIPPSEPLRHYELNHTATKEHAVPTAIRHKVRDYMATLDLCDPDKVVSPNRPVPNLYIFVYLILNKMINRGIQVDQSCGSVGISSN